MFYFFYKIKNKQKHGEAAACGKAHIFRYFFEVSLQRSSSSIY